MSNAHTTDLSIVIPAFDEAERISATVASVAAFARTLGQSFEIVVVDDGSSDATAEVVEGLMARHPAVRLVHYPDNRGKGHAVRVGMLAAYGAVRIMMDADGSTPATEIPKLLAAIADGADIAIGSRYLGASTVDRKQPRWRVLWSRLCNAAVQKTLTPGIADTQCGFKGFTACAARRLFSVARIDGWAFDLEILALARDAGLQVRECPVSWSDDPRSRVSPVRDFGRVVKEWWTIRQNLRSGVYRHAQLCASPVTSGSFPAI